MLKRIINKLYELSGFNAFESNEFSEAYLSKILGGKQTGKTDKYDCDLNGLKIEIKFSAPITDKPNAYGKSPVYFFWCHLLGSTQNAKIGSVDYYILAGYYKRYYVWVIPSSDVKKNTAEYQVFPKINKSWGWVHTYYVGDENDMKKYFKRIK